MNAIEERTLITLNRTLAEVSAKAQELTEEQKKNAATKLEMAKSFAECALEEELELTEHDGYKYKNEPTGKATTQDVLDALNAGIDHLAMLHGMLTEEAEAMAMEATYAAMLFAQTMICARIELDADDGFKLA